MTPFRRLAVLSALIFFAVMGFAVDHGRKQGSPLPIIQPIAFHNPPILLTSQLSPDASLWTVITQGFSLNHETQNPRVQNFIRYDIAHKNLTLDVLNNSRPILYTIVQAIQTRNLPMELALLPAVESGYRLGVQSGPGAMGPWQLLPQTAQEYGVTVDSYWYDGRQDMQVSTFAALSFLSDLYNSQNHNWLLAIAAYNSGGTTVKNAIAVNQKNHLPTDYFNLKLPDQTQDYVPKLLALCEIIAHPDHYGFTLPDIPNKPTVTQVFMTRQINLATASAFAGVNLDTLNNLNSAFLYGILPNQGPSYLYIPATNTQRFEFEAKHHSYDQYWRLYEVEPGEFLTTIAKNHQTNISTLAKINNLSSLMLQPHQTLITPASTGRIRKTDLVKPHETLASFAARNNTNISSLALINGLDPLQPIRPEMRLIIN